MEPIVRIAGLSHRYTTAWAVSDINFEINKKGIYGLLGSNGAGKSTILNILCGTLNQTKGDVYINGIDIRKNPIEAKRHLGFLAQSAPSYLDLTVNEFLLYAARLRDIPEKDVPKALENVMRKCGVTHVKNRLLKNLSGGYRQRAAIAQAIIHQPRLVILDEPTNGLDPVQIVEVRNLIKDIASECTVILSSHILSEIQVMCQDIIMIEQGKLAFNDSMDAFNNYIAPQSMMLEFENAPTSDVLGNLKGIDRVEQLTPRSFRLFYNGQNTICEQIIIASVVEKWRLVQLSIEKNSVDEIFKQLARNINSN